MLKIYDFHIDFHFRTQKVLPGTCSCARPPYGAKSGPASWRIKNFEIFLFRAVFYEYWQWLAVADSGKLKVGAKRDSLCPSIVKYGL